MFPDCVCKIRPNPIIYGEGENHTNIFFVLLIFFRVLTMSSVDFVAFTLKSMEMQICLIKWKIISTFKLDKCLTRCWIFFCNSMLLFRLACRRRTSCGSAFYSTWFTHLVNCPKALCSEVSRTSSFSWRALYSWFYGKKVCSQFTSISWISWVSSTSIKTCLWILIKKFRFNIFIIWKL